MSLTDSLRLSDRARSLRRRRTAAGLGAAAWPVSSRQDVPVWAIVAAGLSPALIVAGWLTADALQPASYSPVRQTVSVLAGYAGTDRWLMTGALLLVGGCHLVTAAGLGGARASARVLLIVAGLSSIGIAVCPEPVHGSTPPHLAWTALGAVTIAIWPAFAARRAGPRPLILRARGAAAVTAAFLALLGWLIIETQGGDALGLAERLTSAVQISWPLIVALTLRRAGPRPRQSELPGPGQVHADPVGRLHREGRRAWQGTPILSPISSWAAASSSWRVMWSWW
jgi:hypothetical membrane protein